MVCTTITMHVCPSVCLFVCSLVPSIGKMESVAASSCKEVRDVLSNKCSGGRQSGTYWITVTDPYTQHNSTMRVGQKHTCLGNYKVIVGICLNRTQIRLQMGTTPLHSGSLRASTTGVLRHGPGWRGLDHGVEALLHGGSPPHQGHVLLQPALQGVLRHGGRMVQHTKQGTPSANTHDDSGLP